MSRKVLTLKWRMFNGHMNRLFKDLSLDDVYTDVTLVSDDRKIFKVHKFVLSAYSPVFKDILLSNPHEHPLVYLRGIRHNELKQILQFMYEGKAEIRQESINSILNIAKAWKINSEVEPLQERVTASTEVNENNVEAMESSKPLVLQNNPGSKNRTLTSLDDMSRDNEVALNCEKSSEAFSSTNQFSLHRQSNHESIKYSCDHCEYQSISKGNLKKHNTSIHDGVRHPCNNCDYLATTKSSLRRHQKRIHESGNYTCNTCDFQTSRRNYLVGHKYSNHSLLN